MLLGFVLTFLKAGCLVAMAALLSLCVARNRPRLSSVILASALLGVLCLPVLDLLGPKYTITLPEWLQGSSSRIAAPAENTEPIHTASLRLRHDQVDPTRSSEPMNEAASTRFNWRFGLVAMWCAGFAVLLWRQLFGWVRIHRSLSRAQPVPADWQATLERSMRLVGCRRQPRLVLSAEISTPATAFVFRPVIMLPLRATNWLLERQEIVLQHELVHIARSDWLIRELARLACAVHWLNPIVWWALRRLVEDQERACDADVVAAGTRPSSYAATLLELARSAVPRPAIPVMEMAQKHHLEGRIMRILSSIESRPKRSLLLTVVLVFGALVPTIAALQLGDPPPRKASQELKDAIAKLEEIEVRMEPHLERIEDLDLDIDASLSAEIAAVIDDAEIDRMMAQIEPMISEIQAIQFDIQPQLKEIQNFEIDIPNIRIGINELDELEELEGIMEPQLEQIEIMMEQLKPMIEQIQDIEIDMEPFQAQIDEAVRSIEPRVAEIEEKVRAHIEPMESQIEAITKEIEPFEEEIEAAANQVEREVAKEIERVLAAHLAPVTSPGTTFDEAAGKICDGASIHVDDDTIRISEDADEIQAILEDLYSPARIGTEENFDQAMSAAAQELNNLRILLQ